MTEVAKRLSFLFTVAIGIVFAGCGGPQQIGQKPLPQQIGQSAFRQPQGNTPSTPLPRGAVSHRSSRPPTRYPQSSRPLLYVGQDYSSAVDIFPFTGPNQQQIGTITNGVGGPWGLSLDANNSLYVANAAHGTVTVYPYGSTSPSMTYSKRIHGALYALADAAGHVFVSGQNKHGGYVVKYNAGTNVVIRRKELGSETDGMAEDASGNLYVAYRGGNTFFPNDSIAEFRRGFQSMRLLGMTIDQPQGLLVDSAGNIVVVESALDTIEVFPPRATTPSVTVTISGIGNLAELSMQNSETTLVVSSEGGYVYSMPYPLTPSTVATEYEQIPHESNGIAVSNPF